ncbi:MAG: PIG-L family deacetylase [Bowdeniella nasicola]|nr:PIG-L family deacetylase [Bowdeniella nasicola]
MMLPITVAELTEYAPLAVAHAHPDDETLSTGPLLNTLVELGAEVMVITATRGERGEIRADVDDPRPLVDIRRDELAAALRALGVSNHAYLGGDTRHYPDSGMRWIEPDRAGPDDSAPEECFSRADISTEIADLARAVTQFGAGAIISYDDVGTYGHPDHVRMAHVARGCAAKLGVPMVEIVSLPTHVDAGDSPAILPTFAGEFNNLAASLPAVRAALGAYGTQLEIVCDIADRDFRGVRVRHVGGQFQDIWAYAPMRLVTR